MASSLEQSSAVLSISSMGGNGSILVTDTTVITGEFRAMKILTDATFTTLTTPNITKNGSVTAVVGADWGTLTEDSVIETKITACTLATGKVLLYK